MIKAEENAVVELFMSGVRGRLKANSALLLLLLLLLLAWVTVMSATSPPPTSADWESRLQFWRVTQLTAAGRCVIHDCSELASLGAGASGRYTMLLAPGEEPVQVYCDMETAGGGWTVFQRRQDDPEQLDFYRDWQSYRDGFGNVSGQFWLGNELLHRLTARRPQELRIDLEDFEGGHRFAQYGSFSVSDEADQYRLQLSDFSGDAGHSMPRQNGQQFSTRDRDNDAHSNSCARTYKGAWWYEQCHDSNLNGLYLRGSHPDGQYGGMVTWKFWKGQRYSLKFTEMKTRPAGYAPL
ncbi:ficolin-2-like [Pollicipes pollicipes]|uniref:ficolin-2-like n=1 Tax=Pollicipes pollicipes TaxID=41117 RepID=UPI0018852BA3|nr:ficolin-2-like [Pollicipes pollicipes]